MIHSEILQSHAVHEMSEKILDVHRNVNMSSVSWQTLAFGWLRLVSFLRLFLSLFRFRACPTGQNAMVNVLHFSTFHTDGPLHISSSMMFNVKICYTNLYQSIPCLPDMSKDAKRESMSARPPCQRAFVIIGGGTWALATTSDQPIVRHRPSAKQTPAPRWTPPHWCLTRELGLRRKNSQSITKSI